MGAPSAVLGGTLVDSPCEGHTYAVWPTAVIEFDIDLLPKSYFGGLTPTKKGQEGVGTAFLHFRNSLQTNPKNSDSEF